MDKGPADPRQFGLVEEAVRLARKGDLLLREQHLPHSRILHQKTKSFAFRDEVTLKSIRVGQPPPQLGFFELWSSTQGQVLLGLKADQLSALHSTPEGGADDT